jgi:hypothetical protein
MPIFPNQFLEVGKFSRISQVDHITEVHLMLFLNPYPEGNFGMKITRTLDCTNNLQLDDTTNSLDLGVAELARSLLPCSRPYSIL